MVPISTTRPCLLLKCLFRIHTTESVLCPETQTSTHPIHCSSTHWLQLIDTPSSSPSSDFSQLSKQTSLLSSQAGAQWCSAWAVGGALACRRLTVFTALLRPLEAWKTRLARDVLITSLLHHHSEHVTRGSDKDAGPILLCSAYQEEIYRNSTERGGREGSGIAVVHSSSSCFS